MAELEYKTKIEKACIEKYGIDNQMLICIEEMSELTKAIIKYRRFHSSDMIPVKLSEEEILYNLREEIGDVSIMLDQLKMVFGEEEINQIIHEKVVREEKRLEG